MVSGGEDVERTQRKRRDYRKPALGERERRELLQLVVCLALFLAVYVGRGVFPAQTEGWRANLLEIIRQDTDFRAVFTQLGQAVAEEAPVLETLDQVWGEVFGGQTLPMAAPDLAASALLRLETEDTAPAWSKPGLTPGEKETPETEQTPAQRDLGLSDSMTPVMGVLTSIYGMRDHPIDGEKKMHDGIDLAADTGTAVLAFADGKVDYIGESPAYGMYLQLRHDNGVTTFYAHCSELCVQKGQTVKMGDVVARVGDTGNTTGPHLHFEMKQNGKFVDPQPYIDYLTE